MKEDNLTEYRCSRCGEQIPVYNLIWERPTLAQRVMGLVPPVFGFWCPKCGDRWICIERVVPKITIVNDERIPTISRLERILNK